MDSWIDFCAHEIELPATIWCYPVIGYMPYNDAAVTKAKEDLKTALGALEKALLEKTYLVRNCVDDVSRPLDPPLLQCTAVDRRQTAQKSRHLTDKDSYWRSSPVPDEHRIF